MKATFLLVRFVRTHPLTMTGSEDGDILSI